MITYHKCHEGTGYSPNSLIKDDFGFILLKKNFIALAGVAQWIEYDQGVASSIPSQGTCLGCRPGPQWGPHERQPHIDVSLPFPLYKINK